MRLSELWMRLLSAGFALTLLASAQSVPLTDDAHFVPGSSVNFGAAANLSVGSPSVYKGLVRFDLSALPPSITVTRAILVLYARTVTTGGTINFSKANGSWNESTVNGTTSTPVAGGAVASGVAVPAISGGYMAVDVTGAVNDWIATPTSNNGFILEPADGNVNVVFDSKENTATSHPPYLSIMLGGPAGAAGATGAKGATGATGPAGTNFITIQNAGITVGSNPVLNVSSTGGVLFSASDAGSAISLQAGLDTATSQTKAGEQSGAALLCASSGTPAVGGASGAAYSCAMNPTLNNLTTGMVLRWQPDRNGAGGGITLSPDGFGPLPITLADGTTNPGASDIASGQLYQLWYDGNVFRMMGGFISGGVTWGSVSASGGATGPQGQVGPAGAPGPAGPAGPAGAAIAAGGYYLPFGTPTGGGATGLTSAGQVKLVMFVPSVSMTVASVAVMVKQADSTACNSTTLCTVGLGLYSASGNLIGQGVRSFDKPAPILVAMNSPVTLSQGTPYYFAWTADNPTVTLEAVGDTNQTLYQLLNMDVALTRDGIAGNAATGSGSALTLPSSWGSTWGATGGLASVAVCAFLM